jgi:hypothetical protein
VTLPVLATASDGSSLVYSASGLPPGMDIDPRTGVITGVPTTEGRFDVTVTACLVADPAVCDPAAFGWLVGAAPSSPDPGSDPDRASGSGSSSVASAGLARTGWGAAPLGAAAAALLVVGGLAVLARWARARRDR